MCLSVLLHCKSVCVPPAFVCEHSFFKGISLLEVDANFPLACLWGFCIPVRVNSNRGVVNPFIQYFQQYALQTTIMVCGIVSCAKPPWYGRGFKEHPGTNEIFLSSVCFVYRARFRVPSVINLSCCSYGNQCVDVAFVEGSS